jgi:exonuclease SbcC
VTQADVDIQNERIASTQDDLSSAHERMRDSREEIEEIRERISKIGAIKGQFPVEDLKERLEAQQDLEKFLVDIKHQHEKEKSVLKMQEKSIKKLEEVPCGDQFPTCKFIKDSHKHKKLVTEQIEKTTVLLDQVRAAQSSLRSFRKEALEEKIRRYNSVLQQEGVLKIELSKKTVVQHELKSTISSLSDFLEDAENQLRDMRLRVSDSEQANEVCKLRGELSDLDKKSQKLDASRMSLSETVGLLTSEIDTLREERVKYKDLLMQWKTYDLFLGAVSKKGIPLRIITSQLPAINSEISKILQGVVGFTVELEADPGSNAMDIYIDYGDSRRIIECASGMEKMVSSLAIRVALINISSLPKTDMLIIDEGFGALDEMNIESCNRLLESLKKWFKNILVISHVDAVKDAVDNVLDITKRGKDAMVRFDE